MLFNYFAQTAAKGLTIDHLCADAIKNGLVILRKKQILGQLPHTGKTAIHARYMTLPVNHKNPVTG